MENLKEKKLLILGGAALHKKVVEAAKELGIYSIVTDNIPNSPAKQISDKSYDINVSDVDGIVEMCIAENVDAVISVCLDFCQPYYREICERLNLPCFGTKEQFDILTKKELFKQACLRCGVDIIPTYTEQDVYNENENIQYPILVKPSQNRGSRGITVCTTNEQAQEAVKIAKKLSGDGRAIVEKYMGDADDFQITYLVVDGVPHVVRTADRYLGDNNLGMGRVAVALSSPSKHTALYYDNVHHRMIALIKHLGLENAPVFFQGFVDGDTIRFYDPGLRFPGGDYDRIFAEIMGLNLMKSLIECAFTGKMESVKNALNEKTALLDGKNIFTLHSTIKDGIIAYETPTEELVAIRGVKHVTYRHAVGEKVKMTYDVNQRIAEINILGQNLNDTINIINEVQNKLKVTDINGNNMIFCEYDANLLK